jgi:hypothetical protein
VRGYQLVLLALCFAATGGCQGSHAPPSANQPVALVVLDRAFQLEGIKPFPGILYRSDTLAGLVAVAKPLACWDHFYATSLLWVTTDSAGVPSFTLGTAGWFRNGKGPPFWAVVKIPPAAANDFLYDGDLRQLDAHNLPLVEQPSTNDQGSGDYARVLAVDGGGGATLFELGTEFDAEGSGHSVEQRRIFVLRKADRSWQFVGEGPEESSGKSGVEDESSSATYTAVFTHDPAEPVAISVATTDSHAVCSDAPFVPGAPDDDPDLTTQRDGLLDGPLPSGFHWVSPTYVVVEKADTVDLIARRIARWAVKGNQMGSPAALQFVRDSVVKANPGIDVHAVVAGSKLVVPDIDVMPNFGPG